MMRTPTLLHPLLPQLLALCAALPCATSLGCIGPPLSFGGGGGAGTGGGTTSTSGEGSATVTTTSGGGSAASTGLGGAGGLGGDGGAGGQGAGAGGSGGAEAGCRSGHLDGDETDVDCGGSCDANCVTGELCATGTDCESNVCGAAGTCESGKLVFVSPEILPDFGGAVGGDALCQLFADEVGFAGTFLAWVSDVTTSPLARFTPSPLPYRQVDGSVVAVSWDQLISGTLQAGIEQERDGTVILGREMWTATNQAGAWTGEGCLDWTSTALEQLGTVGLTSTATFEWTSVYAQFCDRLGGRLYCFQQ